MLWGLPSMSILVSFYPSSQIEFPINRSAGANVNQTSSTNRTLWPLNGGSLELDLHHPWTYVFVNLGIGADYPAFNISLTNQPLNETGNGTLCLPQLAMPSSLGVVDGQKASIQVVTFGETGSALYNVSPGSCEKVG